MKEIVDNSFVDVQTILIRKAPSAVVPSRDSDYGTGRTPIPYNLSYKIGLYINYRGHPIYSITS